MSSRLGGNYVTSKQETKQNDKAVNNAGQITLLFWGLILLLNAIFESIPSMTFTLTSLIILLAGMIVFFVSYLIFGYKYSKENQ